MIVTYSKIKGIKNTASRNEIITKLNIDLDKKFSTKFTKGVLNLSFNSQDVEQLIGYFEFEKTYYILKKKKDRLILHFGFTKIKGTVLFLSEKGIYDSEILNSSEEDYLLYCETTKTSPYSHIAFISDDLKLFFIEENYDNKIRITAKKPIDIIGSKFN